MIPRANQAHNPNSITIDSVVFTQMTAECPHILQMPVSPLKITPSQGGPGPVSNTWFPGPMQVLNANGISIG